MSEPKCSLCGSLTDQHLIGCPWPTEQAERRRMLVALAAAMGEGMWACHYDLVTECAMRQLAAIESRLAAGEEK